MSRKRWIILALVLGALVFALQGGEYSTGQWLELRRKERTARAEVDSLAREVDSLARLRRLVETDPAWQERIAREQYGMLRKGEIEFTVVRPDER
ncbi:MAG TPA: septum formation initiator family protein [Gemmatimonadales bacterium]|jgi:cell division protein FtsB|nr:septum formation initiator family protein [Gemmatimonadales bacterium]